MPSHTIAVATSTRADYGLLRPLIRRIHNDPETELMLLVTGSHLMPELGYTVREIEGDGFPIARRIDIMAGTNGDELSAMANTLRSFGEVFKTTPPDILIVLGDRYEMFSVVTAAAASGVPVVHISGGETTEGAKDEFYRHCMTKMSALHFPSADVYHKRVTQLGEQPSTIVTAGALGVENAQNIPQVPMEALSQKADFDFSQSYLLATYHPVTLGNLAEGVDAFLDALEEVNLPVLFTKANADEGGDLVNAAIEKRCDAREDWKLVASLGAVNYLSALRLSLAMVGNSSSALTEAPAVGKPAVNIGDRQKGRYTCPAVITCGESREEIVAAIKKAISPEFLEEIKDAGNPFDKGGASEIILREVKAALNRGIPRQKTFYDINF